MAEYIATIETYPAFGYGVSADQPARETHTVTITAGSLREARDAANDVLARIVDEPRGTVTVRQRQGVVRSVAAILETHQPPEGKT
jgi:hypothetical protein